MRHPLFATLAAAALLTSPLAAQGASTIPACRSINLVQGSYSEDTLFLALDPGYGIRPVAPEIALTSLAVIADSLALPTPVPMPPVLVRWTSSGGGEETAEQGLMAEAFVELDGKGKPKRAGLSQTSLSGPIDDALVAAVKAGMNNGAFMGFEKAARGPGGYVFVQLRTVPCRSSRRRRPSS